MALAIVAPPRDLRVSRLVGIACATLLGSYWYLVNAFEGGGLLGDRPSIPGLTSLAHPRENLVTLVGDLVDWLDLSGSDGADLLLYALAALAVTSALALTGQPRRTSILAGALVALPLLIWVAATQVGRPALMAVSDVLDSPQAYLAEGTDAASPTVASDTGSWFGPVGLLLGLVDRRGCSDSRPAGLDPTHGPHRRPLSLCVADSRFTDAHLTTPGRVGSSSFRSPSPHRFGASCFDDRRSPGRR